MITFTSIRTTRFTFTLQELSLGDARFLIEIQNNEQQRGEFLKRAIKSIHWNKEQEKAFNLGELTVQERLYIECMYLSSTSDTPNFIVSNGKLSDFLMSLKQFNPDMNEASVGEIDGQEWFIRPLTGAMLEIIEDILFQKDKCERIDWIIASMASQFFKKKNEIEPVDPYLSPVEYEEYIKNMIDVFNSLPESAFAEFLSVFFTIGLPKITHFFNINFDDKGVICMPAEEEKEGLELNPARFLSVSAISSITLQILGRA